MTIFFPQNQAILVDHFVKLRKPKLKDKQMNGIEIALQLRLFGLQQVQIKFLHHYHQIRYLIPLLQIMMVVFLDQLLVAVDKLDLSKEILAIAVAPPQFRQFLIGQHVDIFNNRVQMELRLDVVAFAEIPEEDQVEGVVEGVRSLRT